MASIGVLAAGVAHEINNPLTYLLASIETLLRRSDVSRDARDVGWLAAALEGTRRIRDIVADLGAFSRVADGTPTPLEVQPLLDAAVRMASHEIRYRARMVRDFAPTPKVLATEGRLGQVFLNLVVNAAQAIPEGASAEHQLILATRVDDAGRVVVEVSDTGAGIPPELLPSLFEPFVTSKPQGVGTGLGLYICKNVVTGLGGTIEALPRPGGGTCMRVTLPAAVEADAPRAPNAPDQPAPGQRLQILLVDDERAITRMLVEVLRGHDVVSVHSGEAAIAALTANRFDLILCDVVMPQVGGAEVYEQLLALRPDDGDRIVFMTGGASTPPTQRFLAQVSGQILAKPFTTADVLALVERAQRRKAAGPER
ncbi:MAG: ATP-binding protein [Kofleriaceae bacterium]